MKIPALIPVPDATGISVPAMFHVDVLSQPLTPALKSSDHQVIYITKEPVSLNFSSVRSWVLRSKFRIMKTTVIKFY